MNKFSIEPKVQNYEIHPTATEVGVGDAIQSTPIQDQESEAKVYYSTAGVGMIEPTATDLSLVTTQLNPEMLIVTYRPTLCGSDNAPKVTSAIADFYNKVVGSALQSTSISYADLTLFIFLSKEYRAFIKDIDRCLSVYNQVGYIHPAYGERLINAIYGSGVYTAVSAYADQLLRYRNQLAKRVNTHLPMIKGLRWLAFDDLALDNIYCDDPDAKGALIAFSREGYTVEPDGGHAPLMAFADNYFWSSFVAAAVDPARLTAFFDAMLTRFDNFIKDSWYIDVRPYIQNLIDKNGFLSDADIDENYHDKLTNREWAPVYSTQVIEIIKNSPIFGHNSANGQTVVFESTDGDVLEEADIDPVYWDGEVNQRQVIIPKFNEKNMEQYPADNQSLIKALITDADVRAMFNATTKVPYYDVTRSGLAIVTSMRYYFINSGLNEASIKLTSNFVILSTLPNWNLTGVTINKFDSQVLSLLCRFNAVPQLIIYHCFDADISGDSLAINSKKIVFDLLTGNLASYDDYVTVSRLMIDQDNLVKLSNEIRRNFFRLCAFESFYNPESIKGVSRK